MSDETLFQPDWSSPPGATVADLMEERGTSLRDLAKFAGRSVDEVSRLLSGRIRLSEEWATRLSDYFGGNKDFWLRREEDFRRDGKRLLSSSEPPRIDEWARQLPLSDMVSMGWLDRNSDSGSLAVDCLAFFGVPTVEGWHRRYGDVLRAAAYRTSASLDSSPGATAAWLRQGEILAGAITCQPWNQKRFRAALPELRGLTREPDPTLFVPRLTTVCADCGVAVIVLKSPQGCRASGATKFIKPGKAMMLLSARFLSDDQFWFSFFHEAAHLLLHDRTLLFLEGTTSLHPQAEAEANEFAQETLLPPASRREMLALPLNAYAITRFARKLGIAPGIVVGQLQHFRRIRRRHFNQLKRRYTWSAM